MHYAAAKALWDPDLNAEALLADYCEKGYGPAAKAVQAYWDTYWSAIRTKGVPITKGQSKSLRYAYECAIDIYTPEVLAQAREHLAQARRLADGHPAILKRLQLLDVTQTHAELFLPFAKANRHWRRHKGDTQAARETIRRAKAILAYVADVEKDVPWAFAYSPTKDGDRRDHYATTLPELAIKSVSRKLRRTGGYEM